MTAPFTIRIFVPDGDPEGVRIIDRMNWTGLGIVIPRERVKATIYAQGLGRHAPAEIADLGARSVASLAVQIGDKPCGADATAFAMTVSALTPFFNGPLRDAACLYPNLLSYTGRMMQQYYPQIAAKAAA